MSNSKRVGNRAQYVRRQPPPPLPDSEVPPEVDALLCCIYEFLGFPAKLNFVGWLRSHGFTFVASPRSVTGEKDVTVRTSSGDELTVSVSLNPAHIAQACQAIRTRRDAAARATQHEEVPHG